MTNSGTGPARQTSIREHNLALVVGLLAQYGPTSRARLAAITGLTKTTMSAIVDTLVAGGLLTELGPGQNPGALGRPGTRVALSSAGPVGVGVDIDVDHMIVATVDLNGMVRHYELINADHRGAPVGTVLTRAAMALRRAIESARMAGCQVAGVNVALPGLVDAASGQLRLAPNLQWRDVDVLAELAAHADGALDMALGVDNQANLAALAELWRGGHLDPQGLPLTTFMYVSAAIGIGAGLVLDDAVYRGRRGHSGEIGHVSVPIPRLSRAQAQLYQSTCSCGREGCLEQYAGLAALCRAAGVDPAVGVLEIEAAAQAARAPALAALELAGNAIGHACAAAVNVLDLDTIVLGGAQGRLARWLVPHIHREVARLVVGSDLNPVQVLPGAIGAEAAALGAAEAVVRAIRADPASYLGALTE